MLRIVFSLLFLLKEKVTKSSSEFDAELFLSSKSLLTNSHLGKSLRPKGFNLKTLLRAIGGFLEALVLRLAFFTVQLFPKLTRNKALGIFFRSKKR